MLPTDAITTITDYLTDWGATHTVTDNTVTITDGTHTMYITVTDGDCMWELYETDSDGQSDMLGSGHCPDERAASVLIRMRHDAMI